MSKGVGITMILWVWPGKSSLKLYSPEISSNYCLIGDKVPTNVDRAIMTTQIVAPQTNRFSTGTSN